MAILFKTIESKESLGFVASILETKITAINFATSKLCAFIMLPPELSRLQKNSEKNQDQINKLELYNQAAVYLDNKIATNQKVKAEKEYWQELLVQAIAQDAKDLGYREWELENWYSIWQTQRNVAHLNSDSLLNLYQIVQQLDLEYLNLYKQILFFYGLLPHKRRELVKSIKINIKSLYVLQQEILSSMLLRIRAAEFLHDLDFDDLYCFSKVFAHYVMYHEPIDKNYLRQKSRGDAFLGLNNLTIFVQTILEKGNKKQKEELFKIKWLQSGVENVLPVNNHANYVVPTNFAYYLAEDSKFLRKKRFFVSSIKTIIAVNSASEKLSSLEEMLHNRISLACLSVTPEFNSAIMLAQALLEEEEHINQNRPLAIFRFLPFFEQYKIHKLLDAYHGFLRKFAAKYLDGATEVVDHIMLYVEDEIISSLKNCNAQYANLFPSKAVQKIRLFVQLFGDEIRYAALQKMIEPANLFIKLDALEELRKHKVVMSDVSSLVSLSIFVKRNYSLPESIAINKIINLIVKHDYPKDEKADKSLLKYLQLLFRECKYKEVVANNFLQEEILAKYVYYSDCANEDAYNFLQRCSPLLMAKWKELRSISLVQQFMFINKLLQMKSGNEVNIYAKYGYNNLSLSLYKLVSYIEGLQQSDIKFKTNYILLLLGQAKEYVTYNYIGSNNIYAQLLLTLCYKNRNGHDILGAYCAKRLDFCYTNHVQVSSKDVKFFGQVKRIEAIHAVCLEQTQLLYSGSDVNFYLAMKEIGSQRLMAVYLNKRSEYILQHNIMIDKLELAAFRIHMDYKIVESALTKTFTQYFIGGQENCLKLLALFLDKEFVSMLYQKRIVKIINKELNLSNEDLDFIIVHYDNDFVMEMLRISLEQNYLGEYSQDIISIAEATNQDVRIEFAIQKLLFLVDNLDAILHGDEEALLFKAYTALNTEFKLFAHELLDDLYLEEKNKNNVAYLESNMFNYLIENFTLNKVQEEYRIFRLSRLFDLNNVILTKQYLNLLKTFNLDLDRLIVNEQNINKLSTIVSGYLKKMDRNGTFEGNGVILIEALQMNLNFYAYGELSFLWLKNYVTNPNLYMTARTKLQAIDLECHLSNLSFVFEDKEDSIDNIAKLFGVNGLALLREFLTQELPLVTFDTHQDVINVYSRLLKSVYLDNFVDRNEHAYNLILISKIICIKDNLEVGYIEAAAQDAKEVANEYIKAKNQAGEQEDQAINLDRLDKTLQALDRYLYNIFVNSIVSIESLELGQSITLINRSYRERFFDGLINSLPIDTAEKIKYRKVLVVEEDFVACLNGIIFNLANKKISQENINAKQYKLLHICLSREVKMWLIDKIVALPTNIYTQALLLNLNKSYGQVDLGSDLQGNEQISNKQAENNKLITEVDKTQDFNRLTIFLKQDIVKPIYSVSDTLIDWAEKNRKLNNMEKEDQYHLKLQISELLNKYLNLCDETAKLAQSYQLVELTKKFDEVKQQEFLHAVLFVRSFGNFAERKQLEQDLSPLLTRYREGLMFSDEGNILSANLIDLLTEIFKLAGSSEQQRQVRDFSTHVFEQKKEETISWKLRASLIKYSLADYVDKLDAFIVRQFRDHLALNYKFIDYIDGIRQQLMQQDKITMYAHKEFSKEKIKEDLTAMLQDGSDTLIKISDVLQLLIAISVSAHAHNQLKKWQYNLGSNLSRENFATFFIERFHLELLDGIDLLATGYMLKTDLSLFNLKQQISTAQNYFFSDKVLAIVKKVLGGSYLLTPLDKSG